MQSETTSAIEKRHIRFLCSLSLFSGASREVDAIAMQHPALRVRTVAEAVSKLANQYPEVLERSRAAGMRDMLVKELEGRKGGTIEVYEGFRSEIAPVAAESAPMPRAA